MLIEKILTIALVGILAAAAIANQVGFRESVDINATVQKRESLFDALNVYFSTHCTLSPTVFSATDLTGVMVSDGVIALGDTIDEIGVFTSRISVGTPSLLHVTLTLNEPPTRFITNHLAPSTVSGNVLSWKEVPHQGDTLTGQTEALILFKNIHEPRCF